MRMQFFKHIYVVIYKIKKINFKAILNILLKIYIYVLNKYIKIFIVYYYYSLNFIIIIIIQQQQQLVFVVITFKKKMSNLAGVSLV